MMSMFFFSARNPCMSNQIQDLKFNLAVPYLMVCIISLDYIIVYLSVRLYVCESGRSREAIKLVNFFTGWLELELGYFTTREHTDTACNGASHRRKEMHYKNWETE